MDKIPDDVRALILGVVEDVGFELHLVVSVGHLPRECLLLWVEGQMWGELFEEDEVGEGQPGEREGLRANQQVVCLFDKRAVPGGTG